MLQAIFKCNLLDVLHCYISLSNIYSNFCTRKLNENSPKHKVNDGLRSLHIKLNFEEEEEDSLYSMMCSVDLLKCLTRGCKCEIFMFGPITFFSFLILQHFRLFSHIYKIINWYEYKCEYLTLKKTHYMIMMRWLCFASKLFLAFVL